MEVVVLSARKLWDECVHVTKGDRDSEEPKGGWLTDEVKKQVGACRTLYTSVVRPESPFPNLILF